MYSNAAETAGSPSVLRRREPSREQLYDTYVQLACVHLHQDQIIISTLQRKLATQRRKLHHLFTRDRTLA
jgi:AraC-like DNA-binding protein